MKMTKKQLDELVDKTGALIGSKSLSPKVGNGLINSYDTTDDHVEKSTQDKSYETPYRRYFGEDDLSSHPLFDISQKAKTYEQFIELSQKSNPKMDVDEITDAAKLFGYRKDNKRIVKEKLTEISSITPKKDLKQITKKKMGESILRFSDGINVDTSGELRPFRLPDGWYVTGEGKLIPVKDETAANTLISKMKGDMIEESAYSLLEKIVKVKTKEDIMPKMVKSNSHIDKAISHLKHSIGNIEKYKDNPKVSSIYKSLNKIVKSLDSVVDNIEDKTELMDSINEDVSKIPFDDDIKISLKKLYKGSVYDKTGRVDDRIDTLLNIHKTWLNVAKKLYSADEIADKLFKSEKNG
jgi:hypothetical protein